jgi:hypothetical protein
LFAETAVKQRLTGPSSYSPQSVTSSSYMRTTLQVRATMVGTSQSTSSLQ